MASMTSMAQNQLLELVRGSPWHATVLRMLGAQVGRGVFLDSLLLLVRRPTSNPNPLTLLLGLACPLHHHLAPCPAALCLVGAWMHGHLTHEGCN